MEVTLSKVLYLVAVIIFVLAAFGETISGVDPLQFVAAGLAFFAAAHLIP